MSLFNLLNMLGQKIECFCLLYYTTHICQTLDVGVFGPLVCSYKIHLESFTRFSTYSIDKTDFFTIVQKAKRENMSSRNIESAWKTTSLMPYNPSVVLRKLAAKEDYALFFENSLSTTPKRLAVSSVLVPQISANVD